jgi:hypothetical protein
MNPARTWSKVPDRRLLILSLRRRFFLVKRKLAAEFRPKRSAAVPPHDLPPQEGAKNRPITRMTANHWGETANNRKSPRARFFRVHSPLARRSHAKSGAFA